MTRVSADNPLYRVGIYIRLSLADGDGKAESDSIGNQRELIHQFLDRHPQLKTAPRTEFVDESVKIGLSQEGPNSKGVVLI